MDDGKEKRYSEIIEAAKHARDNSYSPYSKYKVGAAVIAGSGKIYTGCNIENASFGLTICAERAAVFSAISAGEKEIAAIAVAAKAVTMCGACRQVLAEFAQPKTDVIYVDWDDDYKDHKLFFTTLGALLPCIFNSEDAGLEK